MQAQLEQETEEVTAEAAPVAVTAPTRAKPGARAAEAKKRPVKRLSYIKKATSSQASK